MAVSTGNQNNQRKNHWNVRQLQRYTPRATEKTVLYEVIANYLETFLALSETPTHIEQKFRAFLNCGIFSNGFLRLYCDTCQSNFLVPFSCKGHTLCPSCAGRKMAATAAHLVDRILPNAPVRQWVISFPYNYRYKLLRSPKLVSQTLAIVQNEIAFTTKCRVEPVYKGENLPIAANKNLQTGAIAFVQTFGDSLNVNLHFHIITIDGCFAKFGQETKTRTPINFYQPLKLTNEHVSKTLERIAEQVDKLFVNQDEDASQGYFFAQPVLRIIDLAKKAPEIKKHHCASLDGYSLHAGVFIPVEHRDELETLLRYVTRPAIAAKRLSKMPNGNLLYKLKNPRTDGATAIVLTPLELIAHLANIIAPARMHLVRYFGVLAPDAHWRKWIVAQPNYAKQRLRKWQTQSTHPKRYYSWSELLKRIFAIDIFTCHLCGGKVKILTAINTRPAITEILITLNKSPNPPPIANAKLYSDDNFTYDIYCVDTYSQHDIDSYCQDLPVIRYE